MAVAAARAQIYLILNLLSSLGSPHGAHAGETSRRNARSRHSGRRLQEAATAERPCARRSGVQNQVFYYHFCDKYDLAAWIFECDFHEPFDALGDPQSFRQVTAEEHLASVTTQFERMWEKRTLYNKLFNDHSRNSIAEHIQAFDVKISTETLERYLGTQELSPTLVYAVKFTSYGCLNMTIEWLRGEFVMSAADLAVCQLNAMPDILRRAYEDRLPQSS